MKATIVDPDAALTELPTPPPELSCGCRLPFVRCPVADGLLNAEWQAGEVMVRIGNLPAGLPGASLDDYTAARARWQAARRAYDAHIRGQNI